MIELLIGKIIQHSPTFITLNVNGVGYGLHMSLQGSQGLLEGQEVSLHTYLSVKEDSLTLFGFQETLEKDLFLKLIEVNGVGPKLAQRLLSESRPEMIVDLVLREDEAGLTKLKGIGKKTAGLLILHLKSKVSEMKLGMQDTLGQANPLVHDAIQALMSLGLKEPGARKAVEKALKTSGSDIDLSKLITEALRHS